MRLNFLVFRIFTLQQLKHNISVTFICFQNVFEFLNKKKTRTSIKSQEREIDLRITHMFEFSCNSFCHYICTNKEKDNDVTHFSHNNEYIPST